MFHSSPSSAVLTESVTFSPGPAPVTACTDTSYTVLISSPVKWKVVEFWSASAELVMLIPEWLLLAKKICIGVQTKLQERVLHSMFHAKSKDNSSCTSAGLHVQVLQWSSPGLNAGPSAAVDQSRTKCRTKCCSGPVQD